MPLSTVFWIVLATVVVLLLALNFIRPEKKLEQDLKRLYGTHDPQFARSMSLLLGPRFIGGNRVDTLLNGDEIFPAMLQGIRSAQHSITFETYIYWSGEIGREFADALIERARAGVKVHVLLDWVGSIKMEDQYLQELQDGGVEVKRFRKPSPINIARMNNRTHRKLLVIDGKIGFTGGVGVADQWTGAAQDEAHWRDTHFRLTGPAVGQMQAVFMDNWIKATGTVLHGDTYFPALSEVGDQYAQVFSASPSGGGESMHLMYLMAITAAEDSIELANSYFVPDDMTIKALAAAAKRGVKVRILCPGKHIDSAAVRRASRGQWGKLLQAGIEIAEYQPTMFHVKSLVVDDVFVSVGSTNFDQRSFSLNDEANLNVMNQAFAQEQIAIFENDWARSKKISYQSWRKRPMKERIVERAALLLRSQL